MSRLLVPVLVLFALFNVGLAQGDEMPTRTGTIVSAPNSGFNTMAAKKAQAQTSTAADMAAALGVDPDLLVSASTKGSDPLSVGVYKGSLGSNMPSGGGDGFVILSTGLVSSADKPDSEENLSSVLEGSNNSQGNDVTQFVVEVTAPKDARCASFDFAFYSEEYEEFVGSSFNDTFTAEVGNSTLAIQGINVSSATNIAFDGKGNIISINTVFGMTAGTGTTYDGATSLLTATTPVTGGQAVRLIFTVMDLGDSIYDSAVFLDNFFFSDMPDCEIGAQEDTDGDGLLDAWEVKGRRAPSGAYVNLPAMGADPMHKDLFIEVDYMGMHCTVVEHEKFVEHACHNHFPNEAALQMVVGAFANAPIPNPDGELGIELHIDAGEFSPRAQSPFKKSVGGPFIATNSNLSGSNKVNHIKVIKIDAESSECKNETDCFDTDFGFHEIKELNFAPEREPIFRYALMAHKFSEDGDVKERAIGVAMGIPDDSFITSWGELANSTVPVIASNFMHELGHTLGLHHGGFKGSENLKPNYLSVMNYLFSAGGRVVFQPQTTDVRIVDYSSHTLPVLNEDALNEFAGVIANNKGLEGLGSKYYCDEGDDDHNDMPADREGVEIIVSLNSPVDWNCNDQMESGVVAADINNIDKYIGDLGDEHTLKGYDDWANITFKGGSIGAAGKIVQDDDVQPIVDIVPPEIAEASVMPYAVDLMIPAGTQFAGNGEFRQKVVIRNIGTKDDTYKITAETKSGWLDLSALPNTVSIPAGGQKVVLIPGDRPDGENVTEKLRVKVQSVALPQYIDVATIRYTASGSVGSVGARSVSPAPAPDSSSDGSDTSKGSGTTGSSGGGGAIGIWMLLGIGILAFVRRRHLR